MRKSDRVEALIAAMTLDEKAAMTGGVDMWMAVGCDRLGVKGLKVTDGPNGARGASWTGTTSACAPCGTALGATWDRDLVRQVGTVLGEETRSKGAHVLLAPTVNIHRSPLAGRNFECMSEDPLLTAELAAAYVDGVQSEGVGCAIKHLVANDSEFERHTISSEVDQRTLREIYLLPFELAVRRSKPMSVMSAYNRLNGTYCAEHEQLATLLDEWGFDGFMISDWWGTKSTEATSRHGVDLEMPGPAVFLGPQLADAIRAGNASEADLDNKLRRLLGVMERLGALGSADETAGLAASETRLPESRLPENRLPETRLHENGESSVDLPEHREILRRAARQAVVLLKNQSTAGVPALPIRPDSVRRIAVIGPNADAHLVQGGGSAAVNPHRSVTILDGIRDRFGPDVEVVYARGCDGYRNLPPLDQRWVRAPGSNDRPAVEGLPGLFRLEYFSGRELDGAPIAVEYTPVPRLQWLGTPHPDVTGGDFSLRLTTTFIAPITGPFELSLIVGGSGRVLVDGEVVLDMWDKWIPGEAFFGLGSAEIRTQIEVVVGQELDITAEYRCLEGFSAAAFLLGGLAVLGPDSVAEAAALAAEADAAVLVVGLNQDWETEGADRVDWMLPGDQVALVDAVAAAQPRTAVLVQAGSPVEMSWEDRVPAVAQIWYLGQETGHAIADLVSGDVSPSGRLPTSLPRRFEDHPALENYPGEFGQVRYGEGLFVGYRYYDHREVAPRYCFGHGLGYQPTTIDQLHAEVAADASGAPVVTVAATVANQGDGPVGEVVQLYVAPIEPGVARPVQELKGFERVELDAGARAAVTFRLDARAFQHWDPLLGRWVTSSTRFRISVGASSRSISAEVEIELEPEPALEPNAVVG